MIHLNRGLQRSFHIAALLLVLHAHHMRRHTISAQEAATSDVLVGDTSLQAKNDSDHEIDPLIASVLVNTYDALGINSFQPETVFRDGQLEGNWKLCGVGGVQLKDCNVIPAYREQMSIEYSFDRNRVDEYTLHDPSIENKTAGASAQLVDFVFRDDLKFTIVFHCVKKVHATSLEVFDLTIPILKDYSIKTRFAKNCTSGVHPYVRLGAMEAGSPKLLPLPLQRISMSPTSLTTDLFLRVLPPAESQVHGVPLVESSNDGIKVSLRGMASEERIVVGEDLKFSVMYECVVNGVSDINVVIPVPPWEDIRLNVNKKCGGRIPEMLSIGTSADSSDIVRNGFINRRFGVSDGNESGVDVFQIPEERATAKFYIRNSNEEHDETLHLGRIHLTVSDSEVLGVMGKNYAGTAISMLRPGEMVTEEIRFVCRRQGHVKVLVSIPIVQYEVVDFRVEKRCREPISYKESGIESWWTVGGMEDVAVFLAGLVLVGWCLRGRGKGREWLVNMFKGRGYRAVARTDGQ